ncbi:MAG: helix-turn-helix domain-containing protein [Phaeodactylibacter sp.]|nr:helix-turn-helix domain-containing protein [Phaeodactylibacter sp.]
MKTHTILVALLCLALSLPAISQKTVIPATSFGEGGLPYSILDILQDSRGYMWFASLNGLVKYDGYTYTVYQHDPYDSTSLAHDFVSCIIEDRQDGVLWVGTNDGLSRFDPRTEVFTNYFHEPGDTSSLPGNIIIRLAQGEEGDIWVGTLQKGLGRLHKKTGRFRKYQSFPRENICLLDVWGIVPDGEQLWLGTEMGMFTLDIISGEAVPVSLTDGGKSEWVIAMRRRDKDNILIRYSSGEEFLFNIAAHTLRRLGRATEEALQARVFPYTDREGNTWTARDQGGFTVESPYSRKFRPFGIEYEGASFGRANPILHTADGAFWVASDGNGLLHIDGRTGERRRFYEPDGGPFNCAYSLAPGPENSVWALSGGKLWCIGPGGEVAREVEFPDGAFFPSIIMTDSRGWVWAGSFQQGVAVYQPEEGIFRYFCRDYSLPDSKGHNQIGDLLEDSRGNIWVGTYGGGLYLVDPQTLAWKNFQFDLQNLNSLANNQVNSLFEDTQGNLWIGTGRGLSRLKWNGGAPIFTTWTTENSGLPNNRVFGILQDNRGQYWLSTDGGIACFNAKEEHFTVFSSHDGFRGVFMEQGDFKYQSPNGDMYFYGDSGTVTFHPDSLAYNPYLPEVVLTGLRIDNKEVQPGGEHGILSQSIGFTDELHLAWWQNNLTFEFAALSLAVPEKNRYRYRLKGHDKDWVETGAAKRYANYNNLAPGSYVLEVLASNNDGVWSESPLSLPLTISPPWWKSWWAYTAYTLAFLLLAYSLYRFQLHRRLEQREAERLKEMDVLKTKLYTNITHEFRTPLSIITGMATRIKDNPGEWLDDGVAMIQRNTGRLLQLVNQMLELARLESGNLPVNNIRADVIPFIRYLTESFEAFAGSKDIAIHLIPAAGALEMDFDPEKLQQVLSNLLSNAIKFTPEGGHVYVLAQTDTYQGAPALRLQVRDTGIGIPEEKLGAIFDRFYQADNTSTRRAEGTGIGLSVARELTRLMGGELVAESRLQQGTAFTAFLPVTLKAFPGEALPGRAPYFSTPQPIGGAIVENGAKGVPSILLVEDNADVIRYLSSCLGEAYRLLIAPNGREGLEMAITNMPDLVISDIMMPEMDGYDLCSRLKEDERTSHIPIILLTAKADRRSKIDGLKCGADAYLAKPFEEEEMHIRIQKLLELRRRLQAHYRARLTGEEGGGREEEAEIPADPFLEKVRAIIESHLHDNNFSVGQLCREAGMSHSQLHRKLSALTGQSATYFIRYLRLQHARKLLKDPALTVAAVAYDTGFSDPDYFSKVFRKEFGKTPSEFRENGAKG